MKNIQDLNFNEQAVLIRADLNVPINQELKITDTSRIDAFLPTLNLVLSKGGKPIVMSHLGSPKGIKDKDFSLMPVAEYLKSKLSDEQVLFSNTCVGSEIENLVKAQKKNQVILLENLRYYPEEESNSESFAQALAKLATIYINDAFGTAHRAHASIVGIPKYVKESAPGLLMQKELDYYQRSLVNPSKPLCLVIGGSKVSTKLTLLQSIAKVADKIIIGGAMANTFLAAQGIQMGRSFYEADYLPQVIALMANLSKKGIKLYLPVDFRIGSSIKSNEIPTIVTSLEVPADSMALDIGPASSLLFDAALKNAATIVWNGPMGAFENEVFSEGTAEMTKSVSSATGLSIAGGGDTVAAINNLKLSHKFDFISTGGGAFLALMEGQELPGVKALQ